MHEACDIKLYEVGDDEIKKELDRIKKKEKLYKTL